MVLWRSLQIVIVSTVIVRHIDTTSHNEKWLLTSMLRMSHNECMTCPSLSSSRFAFPSVIESLFTLSPLFSFVRWNSQKVSGSAFFDSNLAFFPLVELQITLRRFLRCTPFFTFARYINDLGYIRCLAKESYEC